MRIPLFSMLLMVLVFLSVFQGCKHETPKIGLLFHSYENDRWHKDKDYLVENLIKLGAEVMPLPMVF